MKDTLIIVNKNLHDICNIILPLNYYQEVLSQLNPDPIAKEKAIQHLTSCMRSLESSVKAAQQTISETLKKVGAE